MNLISPCKGCADRHTACHGKCEAYKEWKDEYQAQQQHYKDYRHRYCIPESEYRYKSRRRYRAYE